MEVGEEGDALSQQPPEETRAVFSVSLSSRSPWRLLAARLLDQTEFLCEQTKEMKQFNNPIDYLHLGFSFFSIAASTT